MGECILYGNGGGTSLNFKIVGGTTEPSNPTENMIWVNTDTPITNWIFSADNPFAYVSEIYTEEGATTGKYLNSSGVETSGSTSWIITDKILLPDGTTSVEITAGSTTTTAPYHWFYDADGNAISGLVRKNGTATYEVPEGAKSIRISCLGSEDTKSIKANYVVGSEGEVLFTTDKFSVVEFNTLKKNGIQVYPISAQQYVNGVLVNREVKTYRGDEWVNWWSGELFTDGNTWDAITGGWVGDTKLVIESRSYKSAGEVSNDALVLSIATAEKNENIVTANEIDITNFSYLKFTVTNWGGSGTGYAFFKKEGATSWVSRVAVASNKEYTLEVPAGGGSYRIGFGISTSGSTRGFRISEARLMT